MFLHRKSADRATWPNGFLHGCRSKVLSKGCTHSDAPLGTALFRPAPAPVSHTGARLPIPWTGGHCRPVITDDMHGVVFQIGFPVLPAASGANSTGRITQVAGQAQGMWP